MSIKWFKAKGTGIDEFYADLDIEQIDRYQKYFIKMINGTDISDHKKVNHDSLGKTLDEAEKENLVPVYLQVMFEQYLFADVYFRDMNRVNWVKKVMHRERPDFFPSPGGILKTLYPEEL